MHFTLKTTITSTVVHKERLRSLRQLKNRCSRDVDFAEYALLYLQERGVSISTIRELMATLEDSIQELVKELAVDQKHKLAFQPSHQPLWM